MTRARRSLEEVVRDLSASSTTMETVSELDSSSKLLLKIPILDPALEPGLDSSQSDAPLQSDVPRTEEPIYLDPADFSPRTEVYVPQETQTDIHVGPGDVLVVVPATGGRLQLSPFDSVRTIICPTAEADELSDKSKK